jgi:putative endonuclease
MGLIKNKENRTEWKMGSYFFLVASSALVKEYTAMLPSAWVYIITNKNHFVLYTGVTTDLSSRMHEHSTGQSRKSFTFRYRVSKLVYYKGFETVKEAIRREKYIKGKARAWKEELINSQNPEWRDLKDDLKNLHVFL